METGSQRWRNAEVSQGKRRHEQVLRCGELDVHSRGQTYTTNKDRTELMFILMSFIISCVTKSQANAGEVKEGRSRCILSGISNNGSEGSNYSDVT